MDQKKDTLGKMPVSPSVPLLTNGDLWLTVGTKPFGKSLQQVW